MRFLAAYQMGITKCIIPLARLLSGFQLSSVSLVLVNVSQKKNKHAEFREELQQGLAVCKMYFAVKNWRHLI